MDCRLKICVLSQEEAGRLEHWGIWPNCRGHLHIKKSEAELNVANDTHRFVGGEGTKLGYVSAIVPLPAHSLWQPVQCHDMNGRKVQGFRTWGVLPTR